MPGKIRSKKQAGYLGIVAGGGTPRRGRRKSLPSKATAREMLRGAKLRGLPKKKRVRKARKPRKTRR
jgi:hypothetical protein